MEKEIHLLNRQFWIPYVSFQGWKSMSHALQQSPKSPKSPSAKTWCEFQTAPHQPPVGTKAKLSGSSGCILCQHFHWWLDDLHITLLPANCVESASMQPNFSWKHRVLLEIPVTGVYKQVDFGKAIYELKSKQWIIEHLAKRPSCNVY